MHSFGRITGNEDNTFKCEDNIKIDVTEARFQNYCLRVVSNFGLV
jgi:hypothetical protein